jgi:hypothetical protein
MKVTLLVLALAAVTAACKEDRPAGPAAPCVEAGELYLRHARAAGQRAFATVKDPNERSRREDDLETELRAAETRFPDACAAVGPALLLRCLRMQQAAEKDAFEQVTLANDAECSAAADQLFEKLYGTRLPSR